MPIEPISNEKLLIRDDYRSLINLFRHCTFFKDGKDRKECWLNFSQIWYAVKKDKTNVRKEKYLYCVNDIVFPRCKKNWVVF
ncbi:MAG: hypothetical protein DRN24_07070 [Thermoplasmata archaeon]|nr:MAG: hypothetical protein DRN24_07070 [Thermoplasmata archaeon]